MRRPPAGLERAARTHFVLQRKRIVALVEKWARESSSPRARGLLEAAMGQLRTELRRAKAILLEQVLPGSGSAAARGPSLSRVIAAAHSNHPLTEWVAQGTAERVAEADGAGGTEAEAEVAAGAAQVHSLRALPLVIPNRMGAGVVSRQGGGAGVGAGAGATAPQHPQQQQLDVAQQDKLR